MGIYCPQCRAHRAALAAARRPMSIERLPDEVLLLILERLPARELVAGAARVNRRWAALVRRRAASIHCRLQLPRLPNTLRSLIVTSGLQCSIPSLLTATIRMKHLRELSCHSGVRFSNDEIALLGALPNLKHLDVFTACAARDVSDSAVADRLQSLVVNSYTARFPGAERCQLRGLHMYGEALFTPPTRLLALLRARKEHLTELTLRCADLRSHMYEAIGDCANMVNLQLYSCWLMSAEDAIRATRPQGLRRLHVTGAVMVRRTYFCEVIQRLPKGIEELALSGSSLGDEHIASLAARLPHLKVLEAWRCRITPEGVLKLAASMPKLEVLDLDLPLRSAYVGALRRHATLEFIRCLSERPPAERDFTRPYCLRRRPVQRAQPCNCASNVTKEVVEPPAGLQGPQRKVRVECAAARFAEDSFRRRGEGFRAKIFYHWTSARLLRPLQDPQLDPPWATAYCDGS
ncbi:uncharacterized protein LOC125236314 [Leguminivora glycinivorella]|uniref:uncharacterized protein LOC125236314 n=1 Tax=Leguminivora glycinivorella TaxID=1035111 RepID=UPI00200EE9D2|nr:uncharacterized protein LOC125236314 [Leguminivora glycinivorella]